MNEKDLTRLLHEAVPPVPRDIADPPLATIRRLARRRRVATALVVAAGVVAVAVGVGGVVAAAPWQGAGPADPAGSTSTAPTLTTQPPAPTDLPTPGSIRAAVVNRAGTELTIYVNPDPARCGRSRTSNPSPTRAPIGS